MKKLLVIALSLTIFAISATPTYAHSGCCSHHGGVSGCGCADGSPLSNTCALYYPQCSQTAPVVYSTPKPYVPPVQKVKHVYPTAKPTVTPKPKKKKVVKKKVTKKVVHKKAVKPTQTPYKRNNKTPTTLL